MKTHLKTLTTALGFLSIQLMITSCNQNSNSLSPKVTDNQGEKIETAKVVNPNDTLMTLKEIKMDLLDSRYEKAEILLGKPDIKGRIMIGHFYYAFYFNKVKSRMHPTHLLLLINEDSGVDNKSIVNKIYEMYNGQTIYGVGNNFQNISLDEGELFSNSQDFLALSGTTDWLDIL